MKSDKEKKRKKERKKEKKKAWGIKQWKKSTEKNIQRESKLKIEIKTVS